MSSTSIADLAPRLTAAREVLLEVAGLLPSVGSDDLAELAALTAGAAGAARAAQAAVVLEADARGVVNASDNPRVHAWVAQSQRDADTPVTPRLCRALDRVARVTDRYDLAPLREAVAAGRVPVEAAEQVAASYARLQKTITVDFWELILTGLIGWAADDADRRDLHAFEEQLTGQYATAAELDDREDRHRRRDFTSFFPTRDGIREARIVLDPGAEAVLSAAITALSAPQPGPDGDADERSPGARRADALLALAGLATRPDKDLRGSGAKARVVVTIPLRDLLAGLADLPWLPGVGRVGQQADDHAGCGTTGFGQTLTPTQVRLLACDAEIIPATLGTHGETLELGRRKRLATQGLVTYLAERDKGCSFPGCTAPPAFCDAHHLIHWLRGGCTDAANMALLCRMHHTTVHRFDLVGTLTPDGVRWHRRDGAPIGNRPRTTA